MISKRLFAHLLIFFVAFTSVVSAQTTGSIRGVVTDTNDRPLPGAIVTLNNDTLIGQARTTYTNELGVFRFPSLSLGTYSVEVKMEGFETVTAPKVEVSVQATAVVPIQMKFSMKAQDITVIGETPIVNVTDAGFSTNYTNELLQEVPTQRSMTDLMQVAPGISPGVGDSYLDRAVAFGSNVQSNSWNVDGLDISSPESGSVQWTVNPDLIQEIQVVGVGAPAEYGNHLGGVFNVVTKKGGNQFHGGASYYYQSDSLTGTNVELDPEDVRCGENCNTFNRIKYDNFSSQLGGPILKDKLSFFAGFEYWRDARTNPGISPAFAPINKKDKYDLKLTSSLGEKHEVNGFFHYEDWELPWEPSYNYTFSALPDVQGSNPAWGGNWTSTLSNNFLLDLNYAGWWSDSVKDSRTDNIDDPFLDYTPPDGSRITHYSGGVFAPSDNLAWKSQVRAKATYYAQNFLNSEHEFRFGVQYSYASVLTNYGIGPNGFYTYNYFGSLYRAYQDPFQYGGINKDLGFFVDDTVTASDKITLNLGVRFDHNTGHMPEFEILTVGQPSVSPAGNFAKAGQKTSEVNVLNWNLISPRLGIVYQPGGDGRSIIQGSFGVYYDHNVSGNWDYPPPALDNLEVYSFNPNTREYDIPLPNRPQKIVAINPDLKAPRTLQYSLGYERQIGESMAFGTQYVYKTTKDLVGWEILGGEYEGVTFPDPYNGNPFTLLNITGSPIFRKGNDPGDFPGSENLNYTQQYHGLIFTFDKRLSKSWSLAASYTWSRSTGLNPQMFFQGQGNPFPTSNEGSDPNNYINSEGRLQGDRPHMFRVLSYFQNLPGDLHASVNADFSSGKHHVRVSRTPANLLNQGPVIVIMQRGYRISPIQAIDLNVGRRFDLGQKFIIRVDGTIFNLLNSDNELGLLPPLRLLPTQTEFTAFNWTQPRRLQIRLGFEF
jgi:hypothetical protein